MSDGENGHIIRAMGDILYRSDRSGVTCAAWWAAADHEQPRVDDESLEM